MGTVLNSSAASVVSSQILARLRYGASGKVAATSSACPGASDARRLCHQAHSPANMNSNHAKPGVLVLSVLAASKSVRGSQKRKVEHDCASTFYIFNKNCCIVCFTNQYFLEISQ